MKKPKKASDSSSQTKPTQIISDQVLFDQSQLEKLCKGFVDCAYYRKAMADPGYLRERAIFDFLTGLGYDSETAGSLTELIRKNYYRAF